MSYIEPNSTIQLYRNIPIDTGYNDTLYFSSANAQSSWFGNASNGYFYASLEKYSYVRRTGKIRIAVNENGLAWSGLIQVNYMRFRNTSFENRWFYAFVISVDYIANNTAEITFSIDTIQTWLIGSNAHLNLKQSFIIRQTVQYDNIGENIEPEPVELNEYTSTGIIKELGDNSIAFVVAIVDTDGQTTGGLSGGVYSGATLFYYTSTASINNKINEYTQKPESIIAIYSVPSCNLADGTNITNYQGNEKVGASTNGVTKDSKVGGYVPRNAKCLTYPYTYLRVFTYEGNYADFRFEYFNGGTPTFRIINSTVQPVKSQLMPENYKNTDGSDSAPLPIEGVSIQSYPVCSWNTDTYASWVSQNSVPMNNLTKAQEKKISTRNTATQQNQLLDVASGLVSGLTSLLSGRPAKAIDNVAGGIESAIGRNINNKAKNKISNIDFNTSMQNAVYSASIEADTIHGTIGSGNTSLAHGTPGYYCVRMCQPRQVMQKVDSYFDMYGYAINKVQYPNLNARSHWTYVRVSDIQLGNNLMPADSLSDIKSIFENGIRFWNNASEVGNYGLDNRAPR